LALNESEGHHYEPTEPICRRCNKRITFYQSQAKWQRGKNPKKWREGDKVIEYCKKCMAIYLNKPLTRSNIGKEYPNYFNASD